MSALDLAETIDQQYGLALHPLHLILAQAYRDGLVRRENSRITNAMLRYTRQVRDFTIVILVATIPTLLLTWCCR
jgi:hypothetical protein